MPCRHWVSGLLTFYNLICTQLLKQHQTLNPGHLLPAGNLPFSMACAVGARGDGGILSCALDVQTAVGGKILS